MKVELEVISKETIKPSSPTPDHLRHHQFSFLDQIAPPVFMPLIIFYPAETHTNLTHTAKSDHLKKSLSETLTHFYPLAGRVKDNSYVDCNDEGVHYFEAKVKGELSDFMSNVIPEELSKFLAYELDDVKELAMAVQVNYFDCGGIAIGLGVSHKLADALSFIMVLNSWSAIARGETDIVSPIFVSSQYFPPKNLSGLRPDSGMFKENLVTKPFVFSASKVLALREKYAHLTSVEYPRRPTRIEALSVFICNRFIAVTQGAKGDAEKVYCTLHAVNLRTRNDPPLPEHAFGNIISVVIAMPNLEAGEKDCYGLLTKIREEISKVDADFVRDLGHTNKHLMRYKELAQTYNKAEVVTLTFSSLCRFPLYEADFGWGKPVWMTPAKWTFKNLVNFMDTKEGDGIEAWITLKEEDMVKFEADEEFLSYVSANPNA